MSETELITNERTMEIDRQVSALYAKLARSSFSQEEFRGEVGGLLMRAEYRDAQWREKWKAALDLLDGPMERAAAAEAETARLQAESTRRLEDLEKVEENWARLRGRVAKLESTLQDIRAAVISEYPSHDDAQSAIETTIQVIDAALALPSAKPDHWPFGAPVATDTERLAFIVRQWQQGIGAGPVWDIMHDVHMGDNAQQLIDTALFLEKAGAA